MAVVAREEAEQVLNTLIEAGHTATFMESRGGMLRQSQLSLFIAVDEEDLEKVLSIVHERCHRSVDVETCRTRRWTDSQSSRVRAQVGGAVIFVWDLQSFEVS